MPPARSSLARLLARLFAAAFAAATPLACSLDWTVRSDPGDGGPSADAAVDRAGDVSSSDGGTDAPLDAPSDAPPDCTALREDLKTKHDDARLCTLAAGQCVTRVKDECECELFVAQANAKTDAYTTAVAAFKSSGCDLGCKGCSPLPVQGTCVSNGATNSCSP